VSRTIDAVGLTRAVSAAAQALVGRLPIVFEPSPADDRKGAVSVPGEGAQALSALVTGTEISVVLALRADVMSAIVDGPLGPMDAVTALFPLLEDALASLEPVLGYSLALDAQEVMPADSAFESIVQTGAQTYTVTLGSSSGPAGVLVLAVPSRQDDGEALDDEPQRGQDRDERREEGGGFEPLRDAELLVTAVLGRTRMTIRDVLGLAGGHVIELDGTSRGTVDLLANGTLVARGEVVVIDDEFGVRITGVPSHRSRA